MTKSKKPEEQLPLSFSNRRRKRVQITNVGQRITEQHHRDECNINNIVARAIKTGVLPAQSRPSYFGSVPKIDYHEAMNIVVQAETAFSSLPATVREEYQNDPGRLLHEVQQAGANSEIAAKLEGLGILEPKLVQNSQQATSGSDEEKTNTGGKGSKESSQGGKQAEEEGTVKK